MRKPRFNRKTIEKLMDGIYIKNKKCQFNVESEWNEDLKAYEDVLYRIDNNTGYIDRYVLTAPEGLWAYLR